MPMNRGGLRSVCRHPEDFTALLGMLNTVCFASTTAEKNNASEIP